MRYYILRNFDNAGYYETRLALALLALGVSVWLFWRKRDSSFLIMFLSGVLWQGANEWMLQSLDLRGARYELTFVGRHMSGVLGNLFQGLTEGGIFAVMGFWFVALRVNPNGRVLRRAYWIMCILIVILASLVGWNAHGRPLTSARPQFRWDGQLWLWSKVALGLLLTAWRGRFRYTGYFFLGLLIYGVITFEPLHILGARYVGVKTSGGQLVPASLPAQALVMGWSQLLEIAGSKIHYFALPYALGWIRLPTKAA